jgi:VCBS repeat-containing protein
MAGGLPARNWLGRFRYPVGAAWRERTMRHRVRVIVGISALALTLVAPATGYAASGIPTLSWSPTTSAGTFTYGSPNGETSSQAFSLRNSGGNASAALAISLTGSSAFSMTADTCTTVALGPGKTCAVVVRYAPTASGQETAVLRASARKATASVTLIGAGATSPIPPVAADDAASITEKAIPNTVSGNVLANDSDPDGDPLHVPLPGTGVFVREFGYFELSGDGSYTYTLDNSNHMVQALNAGQEFHDSMSYVANDGTFNAIGTLTVTIHGSGNNTAAPLLGDDSPDSIFEDATDPRTGNVFDNDSDADGDTFIVTNPGTHLLDYGTLVIGADGSYAYTVDNAAVQWLHFAETLPDVFLYRVSDEQGGRSEAALTFTVWGTDDAPVAVDDINAVTEDAVPDTATGNLFANDTDAEGDPLWTPDDPRIAAYGSFTVNSDGSYTYTLDNGNPTVNALNDGETLTDAVQHYHVIDKLGQGQISNTATLTITIHGSTDDAGG